jgi:hypothetical protein
LQASRAQYAAARHTLKLPQKEQRSEQAVAALQPRIDTMNAAIENGDSIQTLATVYNPCDCDEGEPLWSHEPVRAAFSFAGLSGNVERFEVRCDSDRLQGLAVPGQRWTLPDNAANCRVFVFGDDGASFTFVEHRDAGADRDVALPAVARSDVLD